MKIAHMAAGWDIPIAPHWMANIHVHLLAAVPNGLTVEFFVLEEDVLNFERMVREPLQPVKGMIQVPQQPGHGVELDDEAVARYRIE
jgi:D-arabinonate dehydratase